MKRQIGFFWCRIDNVWQVARWDGNKWLLVGMPIKVSDKFWSEIDETPIKRKENE